jgi:hypothetical protein
MKKFKIFSEVLFVCAAALVVFAVGKVIVDYGRVPYGVSPIEVNRDLLWMTVFAGVISLVFLGLESVAEWYVKKKSAQK